MLRMLLLFLTFTSVLSCKVGNDASLGFSRESSPGGKWFLSTLSPATCSGSFHDYNISFYTNGLSSGSTYNVTLAIWKQVGSDTYEKDPATIQHYAYTHSNNRRKKRATLNTTPFSPAVGIRKGSLIGAYLDTNTNALPVIGRRFLFVIGACVSEDPASTTTLTCNSGNFNQNYVLHTEAEVVTVDCGTPPTVNNATYSQLDNDTEYGARVQYNCSTGYNINGNDTISCLLNASWSLPTPSCSLVDCGNPGAPVNVYTNDNVFTYQSTVQYYCNEGYQLSGDSSIECTANGNWNNTLPNCVIINCTDPGTPTNGERNGMDIYYNSTVSYSCNTGYNLTGTASITCNATGLWSAPVPSCPPVNCTDPGTPTNGNKNSSIYTYNSVVSFQCNFGYFLSGSVSLNCLSNGSWNDTPPTCNPVNCGDPNTPTNGTRNGTVFTFNSTVLYSCDTGYNLTGATSLTCLSNSSWDAPVPSCDIVNCSDPGKPTNGILLGEAFTYNSVVTYNCSVGYNLTGAVSLTCLADGSWNAPIPSCDIVNCSDPDIPTNGERFGNVFTYGAQLVYGCIDEYSLVGSQVITCQSNGYWSDALPNCVYIDCPDPGIPDNGVRTGSNFSFNSSVNFTCYPGYQLTGSDVITCGTDGKWSDDIPACNITYCSAPMSPANGNVSYTSLSVNSSVYFTCNTGYTLTGNTNITCLPNTQWSNVAPTCTITVCPLTPPSHGYFTPNNTQYNYGTIVSVNCNPGYGLVGVSILTCTATGQWSNNIPLCIAATISSSFTSSSETSTLSQTTTSSMQRSSSLSSSSVDSPSTTRPTLSMPSVNSSSSTQPTLSMSSTVMPTTSVDDSNNSLLVIGGVIGAVLFILLILIVAILLIVLLVARSKRKSRKLNVPATINVTNPMLFSNFYNSMPNNSKAAPSEEHPTSDYDDPALTLKHESIPQTFTNLLYSELETLKIEDDNKYPTEEIYDNENIANVVLPPPIYLDVDDDTEGVANSLYFIQEEAEVEKEKDEEGAGAVYFTLEEDAATGSGNKDNLPVYFTLEDERKTVPKFNPRKLAKRNTLAFIQPGESEDEIYGQIERSSHPMIDRDRLILSAKIGSGQFGNVCKGQWKKPNGDTIDVAVKMLQDGASEQEKIKFLQEAAIMSQFTHANVIKLHGVVSDDEHPLIVIEYMPKGDLFGVLQKMRPDPGELVHHDTPALLLSFCQQVCLGMTYLSGKGFVHRDLAARNILVSADNVCKIIDFGLSRDLEDENYYVSHKGAMIPVKWTAPEALNYRKYSTASDVWSYGCLMYEIWSIGCKPYESDSNISALEKICSSERLPPPPGCPEAIYSLMISCWHPVASERPHFHEIMVSLLQPNKNILTIPESASFSHPQAGSLGGTLKAGENMYPEIQHSYSDTMDTAL